MFILPKHKRFVKYQNTQFELELVLYLFPDES